MSVLSAPRCAPEGMVHVVAAAIFDASGQVLVAQRPDHVHQGGLWEFPGGKLEPGESSFEALQREIHEELGITIAAAEPLIQVPFQYADKGVWLDVWTVHHFDGVPHGREGQPIRWVPLTSLAELPFPAANYPIINALQLPDRCLVTGEAPSSAVFLARLERALVNGVRLVQLRAHHLGPADYLELAQRSLALCRRYDAKLMLNCDPSLLEGIEADGVHLTARRLQSWSGRKLDRAGLLSASCHHLDEVIVAQEKGVDMIFLSPLLPTATHPGEPHLGWAQFATLVAIARVPVYGLGGLTSADLEQVKAAGGQGVAAIREFWQ